MSYQRIYTAAVQQNEELLLKIISSTAIDESKIGKDCWSALSQLAFENNTPAVEFLLNHGAHINYAILGFAKAGNHKKVDSFLKQGGNLVFALEGYALGSHKNLAKETITRGADASIAVRSYAEIGDITEVDAFLALDPLEYVEPAVIGAATSGDTTRVEALLAKKTYVIPNAISGYGSAGLLEKVKDILPRGGNYTQAVLGSARVGNRELTLEFIRLGADIKLAIFSAAAGGHVRLVKELQEQGAVSDKLRYEITCFAITGYGFGLHTAQVGALLRNAPYCINEALYGFAVSLHLPQIKFLLEQGANMCSLMKGALIARHIGANSNSQLRFLSSFSPEWIEELVEGFAVELESPLIIDADTKKRAIAIYKQRQKNTKLSFEQALMKTDENGNGLLYLMMLATSELLERKVGKSRFINADLVPNALWQHIFSYITPIGLSFEDCDYLGQLHAESHLRQQVKTSEKCKGDHPEYHLRFFASLSQIAEDKSEAKQRYLNGAMLNK